MALRFTHKDTQHTVKKRADHCPQKLWISMWVMLYKTSKHHEKQVVNLICVKYKQHVYLR